MDYTRVVGTLSQVIRALGADANVQHAGTCRPREVDRPGFKPPLCETSCVSQPL